MKKTLAAAGLFLAAVTAGAQVLDFTLTGPAGSGLLPGNEVPPSVGSTASGAASGPIQYDPATQQLTFNISYQGLSDAFSGAHIHGPATPATTAGILYDLSALGLVNQTSATAGELLSPRSGTTLTLVNNPNGSGFDIPTQVAQLQAGSWYINVHSAAGSGFPGGEIRGQLTPVPEPEQYAALAGLALLGFAAYRRFSVSTAV